MNEFPNISAVDALKLSENIPSQVIIAPSGNGKTTIATHICNEKISVKMANAVGEKNQTTIIQCEYIFDERISSEEEFALKIDTKSFSGKEIQNIAFEAVTSVLSSTGYDIDEFREEFSESKFRKILHPENAMYHLENLENQLSLNDFLDAVEPVISYIIDNGFEERVKQQKKEYKAKLSEIRNKVFENMFEEISSTEVASKFYSWLDNIGECILTKLENLDGLKINEFIELSINDQCSENILSNLFNPCSAFSLVIDKISISMRPRKELLSELDNYYRVGSIYEKIPFRMCLRDTMGLTQAGIDKESINSSMDIALNCKADSILFLVNLEERDDTINESCRALNAKVNELLEKNKIKVSVNVLFTKADKFVENCISKENVGNIEITEDTYKEHAKKVINKLKSSVDSYRILINTANDVDWLTLRYTANSLILRKENKLDEEDMNRFKYPNLFKKILYLSECTMKSILPDSFDTAVTLNVKNNEKRAVSLVLRKDLIKDLFSQMQFELSQVKEVYNGYLISDKTPTLHGRSVSTYFGKLTLGLGHSTNASVYGNFSIYMKALIYRMLNKYFSDPEALCGSSMILFETENLVEHELDLFVLQLSESQISNDELKSMTEQSKKEYIYNFYFRNLFSGYNYHALLNQLAYELSYNNSYIKHLIHEKYNSVPGYDGAMRALQKQFQQIFSSEEFFDCFCEEVSDMLSISVNKGIYAY